MFTFSDCCFLAYPRRPLQPAELWSTTNWTQYGRVYFVVNWDSRGTDLQFFEQVQNPQPMEGAIEMCYITTTAAAIHILADGESIQVLVLHSIDGGSRVDLFVLVP